MLPDIVEECREALADCVEESERVMAMLDAMMDLAEAETGTMALRVEAVDVAAIARDAADLYGDVAEQKGVRLTASLPERLPGTRVAVEFRHERDVADRILERAPWHVQALDRRVDGIGLRFRNRHLGHALAAFGHHDELDQREDQEHDPEIEVPLQVRIQQVQEIPGHRAVDGQEDVQPHPGGQVGVAGPLTHRAPGVGHRRDELLDEPTRADHGHHPVGVPVGATYRALGVD